MRASPSVLVILVAAIPFQPWVTPAEAQVRWGGHVAHAAKSFEGATGAGLRAGIDVPVLPLDAIVTGEYFFADCPLGGCELYGVALDVNYRLIPLPLVRPYATGGLAYRRFTAGPDNPTRDESGPVVGVGVDVALGPRLYVELRYEFVEVPTGQAVWRLGLLF